MTTPRTSAGRVRHSYAAAPVPADVRRAISDRYPAVSLAARGLGVSEETARSLLSPGGAISLHVLDRVRARLEEP